MCINPEQGQLLDMLLALLMLGPLSLLPMSLDLLVPDLIPLPLVPLLSLHLDMLLGLVLKVDQLVQLLNIHMNLLLGQKRLPSLLQVVL
jgi:hypothetical protein